MSVSTIGAVLTFRKGVEDPAADLCELPGQRSPNGLPVVTNGSAVLIEYVRPTMRTLQRSILQQAVTKRVGADDGRTRLSSWRLTSYSQVLPDQPGHATVQKTARAPSVRSRHQQRWSPFGGTLDDVR